MMVIDDNDDDDDDDDGDVKVFANKNVKHILSLRNNLRCYEKKANKKKWKHQG